MKYYSEVLDKVFETEKELKVAEADHAAEEKRKADAKALVAKESADVQDAFKARNAARKAYNLKLIEARKAYNKALTKAKEEFENSLKESSDELKKAEDAYDAKLTAFQKAHPEGYRITLKDGDNVVTLSNNPVDFNIRSIDKEFDDILTLFSNMLRRW